MEVEYYPENYKGNGYLLLIDNLAKLVGLSINIFPYMHYREFKKQLSSSNFSCLEYKREIIELSYCFSIKNKEAYFLVYSKDKEEFYIFGKYNREENLDKILTLIDEVDREFQELNKIELKL